MSAGEALIVYMILRRRVRRICRRWACHGSESAVAATQM